MVFDSGRYELTFASNGEEALGLALVEPPHLVIAEVRLERLDGISLCQRLREHPRTGSARLLILTTSTSSWDMRRSARAGAEGYVTKPFSPSLLVRQVDGLLEGKGALLDDTQDPTADRQSCS